MRKILIALAAALIAVSCSKKEPETPQDGDISSDVVSYIGTVSVDQNDGTVFTKDNVEVQIVAVGGNTVVDMRMLNVNFSAAMPIELDMTVPGISRKGKSISGDNIVPIAMGGSFPRYTITALTGTVENQAISFSMMCGDYPLSYSGTRKQ